MLTSELNCERNKPSTQQLAAQRLETVLKQEGLSMAVWVDITDVAFEASQAFYPSKEVSPVLLLHMVQTGKLLPPDLAPRQQSVEQMLLYLHNRGHC